MHSTFVFRIPLLAALMALTGCLGTEGGTSKEANLRLLNVSRGYDSLDLYSNDGDSDTDVQRFTGIATGAVSSYAAMKADTYTIKIRKTGASGSLLSSSMTLAEETHATLVAYGPTGKFGVATLDEDVTAPDSGSTKVRVVNTAGFDGLDIYLTNATDALTDLTATVAGVATGATSSTTTLSSGTYRLRVTAAGNSADLRLDVPEVTLTSKDVLSIILTDTVGGVLVNAVLLPSQGSATTYANTQARLRGASGLAAGTTVTLNAGGTNLLTRATTGVIGSAYTNLNSGLVTANVYVDGVAASTDAYSLTAGGDYTLLAWSDGTGTHTSLIIDDNHIATSGKAQLRLLNGMSALAGPVSLAIDYSPIAENIVLGAMSSATEISAGTEYQFDLSNALTTAVMLTRSSVTLSASSNYTFFVAGNAGTPIGTLRKDR